MVAPAMFLVKDCTIATLATGIKAQTLTEFRDRLAIAPLGSLYFHFWGRRLTTSFEHPDYRNDFSFWVYDSLHDDVLAERIETLDPGDYPNFEPLRAELLEMIENRLDERDILSTTRADKPFYFGDSKIIIFDTRHQIMEPKDLVKVMPTMLRSSVFYHFIDARRRTEGRRDDVSTWLKDSEEYKDLVGMLSTIDPYFLSLTDLQRKLCEVVFNYFIPHEVNGGGR
jgi:hypothetical protein